MSSVQHIIFDIETISDESLIRQCIYSDSEFTSPWGAIDRYKKDLLESSNGKSDFIPHTFQLPVSIAFVAVNQDLSIEHIGSLDRPKFRPHIMTDQFWRLWKKHYGPQLVTFNGRGFDIPILELCCFRYGIENQLWFKNQGASYTQPRNRFNSESHFDLMEFFTNFGATRFTGGLNLAATLIGKPGKMDTKGSMVQELHQNGETLRIDDYCLCDSLDTYFVFLRTQVLLGKISLEDEKRLIQKAKLILNERKETYPILQQYLDEFQNWKSPTENHNGFFDPSLFKSP